MRSVAAILSGILSAHAHGALAATGAPEPPPSSKIRFESATHDFGRVRSDQKQAFAWVYHNDGNLPLEILSTAPSCGCTATVLDGDAIAPGGTGTLKITFDPVGQSGDVRKTLTVLTNETEKPRTILTIRAKVDPVPDPTLSKDHPAISGQSMLMGACASCHAAPAKGKTGQDLFATICAMCHGARADGGRAPTLRAPDYLAGHDDKALADAIAYGTPNAKMPGFSDVMGGPLTAEQIATLVELLRNWGPAAARTEAAVPSPAPR